jgi:hypothetical protein
MQDGHFNKAGIINPTGSGILPHPSPIILGCPAIIIFGFGRFFESHAACSLLYRSQNSKSAKKSNFQKPEKGGQD